MPVVAGPVVAGAGGGGVPVVAGPGAGSGGVWAGLLGGDYRVGAGRAAAVRDMAAAVLGRGGDPLDPVAFDGLAGRVLRVPGGPVPGGGVVDRRRRVFELLDLAERLGVAGLAPADPVEVQLFVRALHVWNVMAGAGTVAGLEGDYREFFGLAPGAEVTAGDVGDFLRLVRRAVRSFGAAGLTRDGLAGFAGLFADGGGAGAGGGLSAGGAVRPDREVLGRLLARGPEWLGVELRDAGMLGRVRGLVGFLAGPRGGGEPGRAAVLGLAVEIFGGGLEEVSASSLDEETALGRLFGVLDLAWYLDPGGWAEDVGSGGPLAAAGRPGVIRRLREVRAAASVLWAGAGPGSHDASPVVLFREQAARYYEVTAVALTEEERNGFQQQLLRQAVSRDMARADAWLGEGHGFSLREVHDAVQTASLISVFAGLRAPGGAGFLSVLAEAVRDRRPGALPRDPRLAARRLTEALLLWDEVEGRWGWDEVRPSGRYPSVEVLVDLLAVTAGVRAVRGQDGGPERPVLPRELLAAGYAADLVSDPLRLGGFIREVSGAARDPGAAAWAVAVLGPGYGFGGEAAAVILRVARHLRLPGEPDPGTPFGFGYLVRRMAFGEGTSRMAFGEGTSRRHAAMVMLAAAQAQGQELFALAAEDARRFAEQFQQVVILVAGVREHLGGPAAPDIPREVRRLWQWFYGQPQDAEPSAAQVRELAAAVHGAWSRRYARTGLAGAVTRQDLAPDRAGQAPRSQPAAAGGRRRRAAPAGGEPAGGDRRRRAGGRRQPAG